MTRQHRNKELRKKRNQQAAAALLAPSGSPSGSKGMLLASMKQRHGDEASIQLQIDASKGSVEPYDEENPSQALKDALKLDAAVDASKKH